jgi:Protein of unknown function (DUF2924)
LRPGTLLTREWDGHLQRVMVLADGFIWNGKSYRSLSKVAFAITGSRWNGPLALLAPIWSRPLSKVACRAGLELSVFAIPLPSGPVSTRHSASRVHTLHEPQPHNDALRRQMDYRKSVDYCMTIYCLTIVSPFLSKLLTANRSLSHANRVSGRAFPARRETVFERQRQKAPKLPLSGLSSLQRLEAYAPAPNRRHLANRGK